MDRPVPEPDGLTAFYWEGARQGSLVIQRCADCGHYLHPPDVACPRCLSADLVPTPVSGRGRVYTCTVARQAFDPAFASQVPYVLALVELEEQAGLRILTNVVGLAPEQVVPDLAVEVTFEDRGDWRLPQFRLVEALPVEALPVEAP